MWEFPLLILSWLCKICYQLWLKNLKIYKISYLNTNLNRNTNFVDYMDIVKKLSTTWCQDAKELYTQNTFNGATE